MIIYDNLGIDDDEQKYLTILNTSELSYHMHYSKGRKYFG